MNSSNLYIPDPFRGKVLRCFKEDGKALIERLPDLLEEFTQRWRLMDCKMEENLSYHFICYAYSPEYGDVVLKIGVPHLEFFTGIDALKLYNGRYACRLFEADREKGAMLMERLPGMRLRDEPEFTKRMEAGVMLADMLPVEISDIHDFPLYRKQMEKAFTRARCENLAGRDFLSMLDKADELYAELVSQNRPDVLLNGDLHHENILKDAQGSWKVIDPQGRIGLKCLESGRFLLNEWDWFKGKGDLKHMSICIDAFARGMGESFRTIATSCFLDYALSYCWTLEESGDPEDVKEATDQMKCLLKLMK